MLCNLYWVNNNCIGSLTLSNRGKKCFAAPLRGATAPAAPLAPPLVAFMWHVYEFYLLYVSEFQPDMKLLGTYGYV